MQDAPETVIVAADEASLYLQATTMRVWAPRGQTPVVRADAGRAKTCCYGSLNLRTGRECVPQCQTMHAEASANHLKQLLTMDPDVPILLLWDRAPGTVELRSGRCSRLIRGWKVCVCRSRRRT